MTDAQLNKLEKKKTATLCYIKKHGDYYRPGGCGYTGLVIRAGIYNKTDAIRQAKSCRDLYLIPVDPKEHNKMIIDEIRELSDRLIR